jgi:2-(1,2-epoxy-1,2-dihydrophenyl)acetyl-CoA isomerase
MTIESSPSIFVEDGVAVVDLQATAYELDTLDAIASVVEQLNRDDAVQAVVLRGTSEVFWLGASTALLRHMSSLARVELLALIRRGQRSVTALLDSPKLTVAYVQGLVAGGGVDLTLACDVVLAAESARMNLFYGKLGLIPDQGALFLLAQRVGWPAAERFAALSPSWSIDELLALGLADQKVANGLNAQQLRRALRKELRLPMSTRRSLKQLRPQVDRHAFTDHLEAAAGAMSDLLARPEQQALIAQVEAMQRLKGAS